MIDTLSIDQMIKGGLQPSSCSERIAFLGALIVGCGSWSCVARPFDGDTDRNGCDERIHSTQDSEAQVFGIAFFRTRSLCQGMF